MPINDSADGAGSSGIRNRSRPPARAVSLDESWEVRCRSVSMAALMWWVSRRVVNWPAFRLFFVLQFGGVHGPAYHRR